MKCIGGPCDDEWFEPPYRKIGDSARVPEKAKSVLDYDIDITVPVPVAMTVHIYIIDCFHFSKDDRYLFLRHESLTNKQAMLHQFSKKCLQNY
jgi:hypothetical protein